MPTSNPPERSAVYDAMGATIARLHSVRSGGDRTCRFRQWRELRRAPGRALVEAISRFGNRNDRRHGAADRMVARPYSAERSAAAGAWRLPARQFDHGARAAEDYRRARLGIVDAGRSARRFHLSSDGLAYAAFGQRRRHRLAGRARFARARHSVDGGLRRSYVKRTGLDPRPALPVYLAYNFFRIAAILQGIIGRVRDGTATSEFAPAKAAMVRPLADKAWEFARAA